MPGEWLHATVDLKATTWTLQPGHVLRLAIAGTDWPNCWPPSGPVALDVDATSVSVSLPVVDGQPVSAHRFRAGAGPDADEAQGVVWRVEHDVLGRRTEVVTRYGGTYEGTHGAKVIDDHRGRLGVSTVNPAGAWAVGSASFEIRWPEATCNTAATLMARSDEEVRRAEIDLVVTADGAEFAAKRWAATLPR